MKSFENRDRFIKKEVVTMYDDPNLTPETEEELSNGKGDDDNE